MSKYSYLADRLDASCLDKDNCPRMGTERAATANLCATAAAALRELEAENERLEEDRDHLRSRLGIECGCGYDKKGDVCLCHLPAFDALRARVAELEAERDRLRAGLRGLKIAENSYDEYELRSLILRVCADALEGE